jgi:hypothetical protein
MPGIEEEVMSRLSRFSPTSAFKRPGSAMRKGMIVALFAVALGVGLGARGQVAHAASNSCISKQIAYSGQVILAGTSGYVESRLYGTFNTINGHFCGVMEAVARLHLTGAVVGTFTEKLTDCFGALIQSRTRSADGLDGAIDSTLYGGYYILGCGIARGEFDWSTADHA